MNFKMVHNCITVKDIEKSVAFYKENFFLDVIDKCEKEDLIRIFMSDKKGTSTLELKQIKSKVGDYLLGDNEIHFAFRTDDFEGARAFHKEKGIVSEERDCLYFVSDPDGYRVEILPELKILKHIVCWKFKERTEQGTRQENMEKTKNMLYALLPKIDEIKAMEIGPHIKGETEEFDMALMVTFNNEADLETYRVHPEHVKVSQFVRSVIEKRMSFDYYI